MSQMRCFETPRILIWSSETSLFDSRSFDENDQDSGTRVCETFESNLDRAPSESAFHKMSVNPHSNTASRSNATEASPLRPAQRPPVDYFGTNLELEWPSFDEPPPSGGHSSGSTAWSTRGQGQANRAKRSEFRPRDPPPRFNPDPPPRVSPDPPPRLSPDPRFLGNEDLTEMMPLDRARSRFLLSQLYFDQELQAVQHDTDRRFGQVSEQLTTILSEIRAIAHPPPSHSPLPDQSPVDRTVTRPPEPGCVEICGGCVGLLVIIMICAWIFSPSKP
jgi:hypothetical protein